MDLVRDSDTCNDTLTPVILRINFVVLLTAPKLDVLLHKESKTNGVIVAIMFGLVFLMIAHALLIGGKASASLVGIQKCTAAYWGGYWAIFPVFVLVNVAVGYYLIRENNVKEQLGYPFQVGDRLATAILMLSYFLFRKVIFIGHRARHS